MTAECPFVLRQARADDIGPMRALERRAAQKFGEIGYDFCADGPLRDAAEHARVMANGVTFVVEAAGGVLAGFAMIEPLGAGCHLVEIDVDPAHQSQGHARRMISAAEGWARGKGFPEITLTTYRDVPWNAPFYARLGFEELTLSRRASPCENRSYDDDIRHPHHWRRA
jgi:GNAT superfamily N-acetyltransferase